MRRILTVALMIAVLGGSSGAFSAESGAQKAVKKVKAAVRKLNSRGRKVTTPHAVAGVRG